MSEYVRTLETLEMVGGALCLDFVNTINSRFHPEHDYLRSYADLVGWAERAEVLTAEDASQPTASGDEAVALDLALRLRDLLHRIFANLAHHADPEPADLTSFVKHYAVAISYSELARATTPYTLVWDVRQSADALLYPIIYSAAEVLMTDALSHLKECPGCGWLFIDTSKNQSRRWCSMNTCGARSKMRRYRAS